VAEARKPEAAATPQGLGGVCGIYWEGNAWYETLGVTCAAQETVDLGHVCAVYACAKERGVAHCGVCSEFPCDLLVHFAAQSGPDDRRIESAEVRARLGDAAWAEWARDRKIWRTGFCPLRSGPTRT
jgi:hypothetical protein